MKSCIKPYHQPITSTLLINILSGSQFFTLQLLFEAKASILNNSGFSKDLNNFAVIFIANQGAVS